MRSTNWWWVGAIVMVGALAVAFWPRAAPERPESGGPAGAPSAPMAPSPEEEGDLLDLPADWRLGDAPRGDTPDATSVPPSIRPLEISGSWTEERDPNDIVWVIGGQYSNTYHDSFDCSRVRRNREYAEAVYYWWAQERGLRPCPRCSR